jgi:hypothetical protein
VTRVLTLHHRAAQGARLVRRDGHGAEVSIDLTLAGVHIGRGSDCAIRTHDPQVSRRNCKISFSGGRWCVDDLGSMNGTFVNGERVTRAALSHGDIIGCGALEVQFLDAIGVPPEAPAPTVSLGQSVAPALEMRADCLRQRIADLERGEAQQEEEVRVLRQLGQELRDDLVRREREVEQLTAQVVELRDELDTRDRQLERAHDEATMNLKTADEARRELAAQVRRAEEGWGQLAGRDDELEKLRRIVSEQERLLKERGIGLVALETALQEVRADRERLVRENVAGKHTAGVLGEQLAALEQELAALAATRRAVEP